MGLEVFSLKGKLALVTGGGTGIGLGIARAFISSGASVIITGRTESVLKKACEQLGHECRYLVQDISKRQEIPAFVKKIESTIGALDILVNNAGVHHKARAKDTTDKDFDQVLNTNLSSVFTLTRECASFMLERNKGSILMINSMAGIFGVDRVVAYSASKAALTGLVNSLVTEYSKYNVRINAIAPGWIESDMFLNAINNDQARKQQIENRIAMDHFGQPEDIGNAAVFLCSDAAKYVTGVLLPVDGGATVNF